MYKSIHQEFLKQLILATSLFIIVISFMFYGFTKTTIYEDIEENLINDAQLINTISSSNQTKNIPFNMITKNGVDVDIVLIKSLERKVYFNIYKKGKNTFAKLLYPYSNSQNKFIKINKNINNSHDMLNKIYKNVLLLSIGGLIMVILYALALSKSLLRPILQITRKLSNMDETSMSEIKLKNLPIEFHPLANSINKLTNRIESYVINQKELFIGAAHELKTPLAVMKLKNEITIRKPRVQEKYEETLKLNISEIDGMNKMITSILDIGRQESAQFEKAVEIDIISYLKDKMNGYRLLAKEDAVKLIFTSNIKSFRINIQPTLLNQIIQNFVQNAIKFTPDNNTINVNTFHNEKFIGINVIDEGIGIDESIDLFAPFKRVGKEQGAGLGLFLAKSAADALGADISLRNRTDNIKGTVATLKLYINPICKI